MAAESAGDDDSVVGGVVVKDEMAVGRHRVQTRLARMDWPNCCWDPILKSFQHKSFVRLVDRATNRIGITRLPRAMPCHFHARWTWKPVADREPVLNRLLVIREEPHWKSLFPQQFGLSRPGPTKQLPLGLELDLQRRFQVQGVQMGSRPRPQSHDDLAGSYRSIAQSHHHSIFLLIYPVDRITTDDSATSRTSLRQTGFDRMFRTDDSRIRFMKTDLVFGNPQCGPPPRRLLGIKQLVVQSMLVGRQLGFPDVTP